jgi:hypothetical protein
LRGEALARVGSTADNLGDEYKAEQRLRNTDGKEIAPSAGKGGTRSEGAVEDVSGEEAAKGTIPKARRRSCGRL